MIARRIAASCALILLCGCGDDTVVEKRVYDLSVTVNRLSDLTEGSYEAWLEIGGQPVSVGRFTTGRGADLTTEADAPNATRFLVTVEPEPDSDPTPSGVVVLAGDVAPDVIGGLDPTSALTLLEFPMPRVLEECDATLSASGQALHFTVVTTPLPTGFVWEGWAVTASGPISTGRFTDDTAPANVGVVLNDGMAAAALTLEPDIGGTDPTGDGPFAIVPMASAIPLGQADDDPVVLGVGPQAFVVGSMMFQ